MLQIQIPLTEEEWDPVNEVFVEPKEATLKLEHSLVSISKWESKWCKPFYSKNAKTYEETIDYVKCMTVSKNVDPVVYDKLTDKNLKQIYDYIEAPMTATYFSDDKKAKGRNEIVTSEVIYHWMFSMGIPIECEKWHINRLIAQIKVCNIKSQPPKKMSKKELMSRNTALNAARRKKFNSKG